jgi:CubicO group peptidase (beta-lactamase class C family)
MKPASRRAIAEHSLDVEFDEQRIDRIFAELQSPSHAPGAAVGIAIDGRPVYRKGFGLANIELPVALSPSIRMRIGSTTKQFAAFAYLLLCEEGRAGLDDPIEKYLPELHPASRPATMRQLMAHTSGLRDATDVVVQSSGPEGLRVSTADILSLYEQIDDVNAPPGTTWMYNNGAFILLSVAIERIADRPLEQFMRERIFNPIGMYDTLVRRWDSQLVPNSATPHTVAADGSYERIEYCFGIDYLGAGAIASTIDDMLRWMRHMDQPEVGTPLTWEVMKTPEILLNGTSTGYGGGLRAIPYRGALTLCHAGGGAGSNAHMLKVPAAGLDVIVMVNRSDVSSVVLATRIVDACLPGLDSQRPSYQGPFATGVFVSPKTGRVVHLFENHGQQFVAINGMGFPGLAAEPDESGTFHFIGGPSFLKQAVTPFGDRAAPMAVRLSDYGNFDELRAVDRTAGPELGSIVGCYRDCCGIEMSIAGGVEALRAIARGRFGTEELELTWLGESIWQTRKKGPGLPRSGVLHFDPNGAGLRFSTALTRGRSFRRVD